MSEFDWEQPGKHPPISVLLLHLDGELGSREAGAVERHTAQCWECRTACDRLQRGICGFIDYRNQVLLPAVPPPPSNRNRFQRRLQIEASKPVSPFAVVLRALRARAAGRLPWAVAAALATIAAFMVAPKVLSPPLGGPPVVSAAEFLQLARSSPGPLPAAARTVICQKVEIRHGGRVYRREILRSKDRKPAAGHSADLPRLQPVDWSDPLGAEQFAAWHDTLASRRDSIHERGNQVTLSTASGEPADIISASLTVRRSDWHPIAKRVDLREGPPIEIREVGYELRPAVEPPPEVAVAPPLEARMVPHQLPSQTGVTEAELQSAELDLREAFHRIGADVREAPRIWRDKHAIHFTAWVENEERAGELRQAAARAGRVKAEIHVPGGVATPHAENPVSAAAAGSPAVTRPPLAEQLWKKMGGMDAANRHLEEIGKAHVDLLAAASSLVRLAERYPESERASLSASAWQRVEKLAAGQIESVRVLSRRYIESVSPVVAEMMSEQGIASPAEAAAAQGCGAWQELAPAIAADTRSLRLSFRRLFIQEQVDQPVSFGAEALLRDSAASQMRLIDDVRRLCAPGSTGP